jgi:Ca2+-binding EF-hand superfamily protein
LRRVQQRKHFISGDDNGDGVLTFQEFVGIVSKIAPHFPKRRILKMFREALMLGDDDDRINEKSFVFVCKKHGLAQLVGIHVNAITSYDIDLLNLRWT